MAEKRKINSRPPKPKKKADQGDQLYRTTCSSHLQEVTDYDLPPNSPITLSDIECVLCLGVLRRPLQLSCGAICCRTGLCDWVKHTPTPHLSLLPTHTHSGDYSAPLSSISHAQTAGHLCGYL